jgi:2-polyprenyl-3-methyl-5-hydroxy-6-metoxy-1,4-benzoquinol methylase
MPTRAATLTLIDPGAQAGHEGRELATANGFRVIDCAPCGFAHTLPIPDASELARLYQDTYYAETKPTYLAHALEDRAWLTLGCDDRLDLMAEHLPRERGRLLDIGAGPGLFLARAAERGFAVTGIEPSHQAACFAREQGLPVHEAFFTDEVADSIGRFDAAHMMNILEHVPDAAAMIARARTVLVPGGVLCAGVPNDFNPLQKMLRDARGFAPWWVAPPHHINYFNFDTLEDLLRRNGFAPKARLTSFPMEIFLSLGENYVGDDARGRACHAKRKAFDHDLERAAPGKRRALYRALAEAGLGREAIVIATKE